MARQDDDAVVLKPYMFRQDNTVVISHTYNGALRVSPKNQDRVDGHGHEGKFARWRVELQPNNHCKLKNTLSGKYLRIWQRGKTIDVNGGGGPFTLFKIHFIDDEVNKCKLELERFPGNFIDIHNDKCVEIGNDNKNCILTFWRLVGGNNSGGGGGHSGKHGSSNPYNQHPNADKEIKCVLCGGKGYWGPFGWCDGKSVHKKGECPLCNGKTTINDLEWQKCKCCDAKGCHGKFGTCIKGNVHYLNDCNVCQSKGYLESYVINNNERILIIHNNDENIICTICKGLGYCGPFGFVCEKDNRRKRECPSCNGNGYFNGNNIDLKNKCKKCNGKGGQGAFGACEPYNTHYRHPCKDCDAHGYQKK